MQVGFSGYNLQGILMMSSTNVLIRDNLSVSNLQTWIMVKVMVLLSGQTGLTSSSDDTDAWEMPNRTI